MLSAKFAMEVHVRMAESAILPNLYLEIYLYIGKNDDVWVDEN